MSEQLAIDGGTPVRTEPFGPMHDYGDEEIANLTEVIRSGKLAKGPQISRFERDFADRHGVKWGVTVTSGTAAMHVCIGAINPDPGSEIIVTPWTSAGSIIGMLLHNCVPVFADVDETYNIDPKDVEAKITSRTRAIMAVHLFGNPCDMTTLREIADRHNIFLIEDCCQAHFAEHQGQIVGSIGDIAGFSFGGKHISAGGGGIVLTNNESLGAQATLFMDAALPRDDGPYAGRPYANYRLAPNYKINDLIGAVLNAQLRRADGYIENKIRDAENINAGLEDVEEIVPQPVRPGDRHTYWDTGFSIDTERLDCSAQHFADAVKAEGVPAGGPYLLTPEIGPLYRNPFLADTQLYGNSRFPLDYERERPVDYRLVECPYGEELMSRTVNLPMIPNFTEEDVGDIIQAFRKVADAYRK